MSRHLTGMSLLKILVNVIAFLFLSQKADAEPPFLTYDAETVEESHFEVNLFSSGTKTETGTLGTLPGLEMNYGATPDLQLHAIAPIDYNASANNGTGFGLGDLEFGAKYRLFKPGEEDWFPQIATFPLIEVPIGNQSLGFSTGHTRIFLPIWLQKDFEPWTVYGGGGYWINPGFGNKNYGFAGVAVWRKITPEWQVGVELFHQTSIANAIPDSTGFNIGTTYDLSERWHLLASVGTGLQHRTLTDQVMYYLALQMRF
jgi:hypothetical protein